MRKQHSFKYYLLLCSAFMLCAFTTNAATANKEVLIWPALPNESVQKIAAQLYPNHVDLQRKFVFKTLRLNAENKLNLTEHEKFTAPRVILIPTPESLQDSIRAIKPSALALTPSQLKLSMSYDMALPKNGLPPAISVALATAPSVAPPVAIEQVSPSPAVKTEQVAPAAETPPMLAKPVVEPASIELPSANIDAKAINQESQAWQANISHWWQGSISSLQNAVAQLKAAVSNWHLPAIDVKALNLPVTINQLLWFISLLLAVLGLSSLLLARIAHRKKTTLTLEWFVPPEYAKDAGVLLREYPVNKQVEASQLSTEKAIEKQSDTFAMPPTAPEFEEHSDRQILLEAKAYEKNNRADEAIEHVKWAIRAQPKVSIELWLYLLDLYRQQNRQDDFENYAKAMHQTYNVMIPQWQEKKVAMVVAQTLEDFPHLAEKLCAIWSTAVPATDFLQSLVDDNRDGERLGFSRAVVDEILLLCLVLEARDKET